MLSHAVSRFIDSQRWLDPLADVLQKVTAAVYRGRVGRSVKSLFNGTWLGHPLHPVLTDIPLGAWTLAIIFDLIYLFGQRSPMARSGAEILISLPEWETSAGSLKPGGSPTRPYERMG